jgi:hypothetical protein
MSEQVQEEWELGDDAYSPGPDLDPFAHQKPELETRAWVWFGTAENPIL